MSKNPFVKKTIDEKEYVIFLFPLETSLYNLDLLLSTYGEAFTKLIKDFLIENENKKSGKKATISLDAIAKAMALLKNTLKPGDSIVIVKSFINPEFIKHDGKPVDLNKIYTQEGWWYIFKLIATIIMENYLDFLSSGPEAHQSES